MSQDTFISALSGKEFHISERVTRHAIRKSILDLILKELPTFKETEAISLSELNTYRERYIQHYIQQNQETLSSVESSVIQSIQDKTWISNELNDDHSRPTTRGQRIADQVATFGGSWTFIISFGSFLALWILLNVIFLANKGFDPYPFILLNLILSCIAAIQAPVIMMSQNRQEEKDRERAKKDFMINLKAEVEIRALHEKMDHLIIHQQQELMEIQRVQLEMLSDVLNKINTTNSQ